MNIEDKNLSDINVEIDGFKQNDIINQREAITKEIYKKANQGNKICLMTALLDQQAKSMGIDSDYSEDLDEDDFGGMY